MKLLTTTAMAAALLTGAANANPYAEYYDLEKTTELSVEDGMILTEDHYTCEMDLEGLFTSKHLWYWLSKIKEGDWESYENYLMKIYDTDTDVSIFSQQKMCIIKASDGDTTPLTISSTAPITGAESIFPADIGYAPLGGPNIVPQSIDFDMLHDAHSYTDELNTDIVEEFGSSFPTEIAPWAYVEWNSDLTEVKIDVFNLVYVDDPTDYEWDPINVQSDDSCHYDNDIHPLPWQDSETDIDPLSEWLASGQYWTNKLAESLEQMVGNTDTLEFKENIQSAWCQNSYPLHAVGDLFGWHAIVTYNYTKPELEE